MGQRHLLLLLAVGCGRLSFAPLATERDGGGDVTDVPDAAPCGPLGTVRAMYDAPGVFVTDANRFLVFADRILFAVSGQFNRFQMHVLDHDLQPLSAPVAVDPAVVGNHHFQYNAAQDVIVANQGATADCAIRALDPTSFVAVSGPVFPGEQLGGGFIDSAGTFHVLMRSTTRLGELDTSFAFVQAWADPPPLGPTDIALDPVRGRAWVASATTAAEFDFSLRTKLDDISLSGISNAVAVDANGTAYFAHRSSGTVSVVNDSGVVDVLQYPGEDPVSLEYDPYSGYLLIGFLMSTTGSYVRAVCPLP